MRHVLAAAVVSALAVVFAGCPGDPCPEGGRGTLTVELSGLPDGVAPDVALHGPAGHREIASSTTISDFDSGEYELMMGPVAVSGGRVRVAYGPSADPSPVCVLDGKTASLRISYALIGTSGKLWFSNTNGSVRGGTALFSLPRETLGASGTVTIHSPTGPASGRAALAFDRGGNLWTANGKDVIKLLAGEVSGAGALASVQLGTFDNTVTGLAFDGSGALWVSLTASRSIVKIPGAELGESGAPVVTGSIATSAGPTGLAFAPNGALWVGAGDTLLRFDASQLSANSIGSPAASIIAGDGSGGTYRGAEGLAFDPEGNLWVAYAVDGVVARFSAAQVTGSGGTIVPGVVLSSTVSGHGIAFDEEGGLWVAITQGRIGRYDPSQLSASHSNAPAVILEGAQINSGVWPAIYPPPSWSPLYPQDL